jgi:hypothetical protein
MIYVIWTARLAVAAYLTAIGMFLAGKSRRSVRIVRTAGFAIFCLHVMAAFHFVHHWSHAAALQHTAEQTKELFGWNWGGGIWFNYLFLVLWGVDVLFGWVRLASRDSTDNRLSKFSLVIHLYMAFIVLNATVVFGPAWWSPVMLVLAVLFAGLAFRQRRRKRVM